jgi:O-acetylserine/cysteine efflux transporter
MSTRQWLMALCIVTIWGLNFVVIKVGLRGGVPPFLLGCLRFVLVFFPAVLWVPRPRVHWRWLLAYGLTINLGQFALLFWAMSVGMPAGLASLVLQAQVLFTLGLSVLLWRERLHAVNVTGLLIAIGGLWMLGAQSLTHAPSGSAMTLAGLSLTLGAAFSWACGNVISKHMMNHRPQASPESGRPSGGSSELLGVVVWSAAVPILPFALMSWWFEGPSRLATVWVDLQWGTVLAVAYLAYAATILGYTLWGTLLTRLPTSTVAPLTLLVPVVGLSSAWLLLGEQLSLLQLAGAATILAGLSIHVFGRRLLAAWAPSPRAVPGHD